ncbi:MAG: hypothetical protein ABJA90_09350 [Ginsengibacter sp.]
MAKNTGMNAKDEKAGKTAHLSPSQAKKVTKKLKDEENDPAPTKTVALVNKERERRKNERGPEDKIFKSH